MDDATLALLRVFDKDFPVLSHSLIFMTQIGEEIMEKSGKVKMAKIVRELKVRGFEKKEIKARLHDNKFAAYRSLSR